MTCTWAATGSPAGTVTFSANGSNGSKNTVATFTAAGAYTLQVTIADASNNTVTSALAVTVQATATTLTVTPATMPLVLINHHQQFTVTAKDQFDAAIATPAVAWTVSGGGSISAGGDFTAGGTGGGPYTVTATAQHATRFFRFLISDFT